MFVCVCLSVCVSVFYECLCVSVCVPVFVSVCARVFKCVSASARVHVFKCAFLCANDTSWVYVCVEVCIYVRMRAYV